MPSRCGQGGLVNVITDGVRAVVLSLFFFSANHVYFKPPYDPEPLKGFVFV